MGKCLECGKPIEEQYCWCSIECREYWFANIREEDQKAEEG